MKIYYINPCFDRSSRRGRRTHTTQLATKLASRGHELFCPDHCVTSGMRPIAARGIAKLSPLARMDALYLRIDGIPPVLPRSLRPPASWWLRHVPVVWEVNATPDLDARAHSDPGFRAARISAFESLATGASLAICNTRGLAAYATDLGIERTVVIPLGADPDLFKPSANGAMDVPANPDGLNVIWHGAEIWWHDMESMLAAARMLLDEPRIRFFFMSSRDLDIDLPPNIQRLPSRPYEEVPGVLARMDVGLCLFRRENWSRYGTFSSPLKLFEYLASGLVVVASPIEQVRELFQRGEAGHTVPFEDPDALAATLRSILDDKAGTASMRAVGPKLVREFYNWDRVADQTAEAIAALRESRARA